MNRTTVTMPSVTHAIKAQRKLASMGYKSEIKRASRISERGCTHVLIVNVDPGDVIALLNNNKIEYGKLLSGAGD